MIRFGPDVPCWVELPEVHLLKSVAKKSARLLARLLVLPGACLSGFGRWHEPYLFFAHLYALMPGLPGSYLRVAYYSFTLEGVGPDCQIGFGSFFAHTEASVGPRAGIGPFCLLGKVDIGEGAQLAGYVQILSGSKQHTRDEEGRLVDEGRSFRRISIGRHCWIGAGAIVLADVGEKTTVGAGAVVARALGSGVKASGNPAQVIPPAPAV